MKSFTQILGVAVMALMLSLTVHPRDAKAVIANQLENFNDGTFADNAALAAAGYTFTDLSAAGGPTGSSGLDGSQVSNDGDGGDGIDDGAIFVDGFTINETVTYPFAGTIENGAEYMFGANLFKSSNSGVDADVELLANGVVVASLPKQGRFFGDAVNPNVAPITLFHRGTPTTAGQTLSFRVRQVRGNDFAFDVGIDNWALVNRDLVNPIADQFETFTGFTPFGYTWSLNASSGEGSYYEPDVRDHNPVTPSSGIYPGDAAGDGATFVNGNDNGTPTSTISYRFDGVVEDGQQYDFAAYLYQSQNSFAESNVELISDPGGPSETVVASFLQIPVNGRNGFSTEFHLVEVSYTGDATTAGKQLGFRISSQRNGGSGSSDVAIDGWSLSLFNGIDGDFDGDGDVDGRDFLVWQRGESPNSLSPDDLAAWQDNFGTGAGASPAVVGVPEPGSMALVLLGAAMAMSFRGESRSSQASS